MTINLSSKGGSGGTGSATKDPQVLPLAMVQPERIYIKSGTSNGYISNTSTFWNSYLNCGTLVICSTDDTWQTVVDLTSHYGSVYNLIGPTHHVSYGTGAHHFRITVDGIEYLIEPASSTNNRGYRLIAGILLPFAPVTSDINDLPNEVGSYQDDGISLYSSTKVYPYRLTNGYIPNPLSAFMQGNPYLYFTESFKFEVKVNTVDTDAYDNRAGCVLNYMANF